MTTDWRPTASMDVLRARAAILETIRLFFAARGVVEVETPLLAAAPVTDLHLAAMQTRFRGPGHDDGIRLWLQTSPEFAMKRLLAAGSGPIYQLCKAFRDGEAGSRHNPEFTMLEWYRPGWDHHRIMDEVAELLDTVLSDRGRGRNSDSNQRQDQEARAGAVGSERVSGPQTPKPPNPHPRGERITYREAFQRHVGIDPYAVSVAELAETARSRIDAGVPDLGADRDGWLDLLLSHLVEPELGRNAPTFIVDYPASQAALARIRDGHPPVAERFELWVDGVELANGYHELVDPVEQRRRFEADLEARSELGLPVVPIDERLLAALEHGMPPSAGVALGVDRLVMLAVGATRIDEVVAFPVDRA